MDWHYANGNDRVGPVTEAALAEARKSGVVTDATLVWRQGMSDWKPYGTVFPSQPTPPTIAADPYAAPLAGLHQDATAGPDSALRETPRFVGIFRSVGWYGQAWGLFKQAPWVWIGAVVIISILSMPLALFSLIPLIGIIPSVALQLIMILFASGIVLMAAEADAGRKVDLGDMFRGFNHRPGALLGAVGIYFAASIVIMMILGAIMAATGSLGEQEPSPAVTALVMGVAFVTFLPLALAMVFSPAPLTLHPDVGVIDAMKMSLIGCLKNVLAGIVAYVVTAILAIIATIPLLLGWFVLMPLMPLALYAAYKDVFLQSQTAS